MAVTDTDNLIARLREAHRQGGDRSAVCGEAAEALAALARVQAERDPRGSAGKQEVSRLSAGSMGSAKSCLTPPTL